MHGVSLKKAILTVFLVLLTLVWITPLWTTFLTALKSTDDYVAQAFWEFPNRVALLHNLTVIARRTGLIQTFQNSLLYGVVAALASIFIAALAAYGLTRLRIRFPVFWFFVIFSGTIFPFQMYLIPLFKMYTTTGLYDTKIGLIFFYIAICIPFCLFVLRNFFVTIPWEIQEAARLDGCSDLGIFFRIFLPLAKAPALVLFLFQFTWVWNDLIFGLVLSRSVEVRPVMTILVGMQGIYGGGNVPAVISAAMAASVPTVLLFLFLQRFFLQGLQLTTAGE